MFDSYLAQFRWRCGLLLAGRYEDLARHYHLPMPVTLAELSLTVATTDELAVHLRRHHVALARRGVRALVPQVLAVDLPLTDGVQRVWLRYHEEGEQDLRVSQVVYGCLPRPGGMLVASMDYTRLAMPEFSRPATHRRLIG